MKLKIRHKQKYVRCEVCGIYRPANKVSRQGVCVSCIGEVILKAGRRGGLKSVAVRKAKKESDGE